jgi:hypothetical protein
LNRQNNLELKPDRRSVCPLASVRYNLLVAFLTRTRRAVSVLFCLASAALAQSTAKPAAPAIAVVDGGIGPCSLELTVNTLNDKPVYAAKVNVHIAYGFGGFHKLDLEASTNIDGNVKFTGLPNRVRRPPLEFNASKDQLVGTATDDPAVECHAKHSIVLDKPKPSEDQ